MRKIAPSKDETALLPPFAGLPIERIFVPNTQAEFAAAFDEIMAAGLAGFDTESKPTFSVGEVSEGPHVLQFALADKAFIFQPQRSVGHPFLMALLESEQLLKVGFGLQSDRAQIQAKLGAQLAAVLDLNSVFRQMGYNNSMGVRAAVGVVLNQNFPKSKKITTSNWASLELTPKQLLYAANDAYAALKVMAQLQLNEPALVPTR
ncbi:MAG: 3'-5' exonuclease domain-containing protein 2 [Rubrivivax sp.]|nr:MAG: 3'-5' exonuclease domain-containing protein 2 [Rubrivivax sp.]